MPPLRGFRNTISLFYSVDYHPRLQKCRAYGSFKLIISVLSIGNNLVDAHAICREYFEPLGQSLDKITDLMLTESFFQVKLGLSKCEVLDYYTEGGRRSS
jgi:hypothetical protein